MAALVPFNLQGTKGREASLDYFFLAVETGKKIPTLDENNGRNKMNTYYFTPFPTSMHSWSEPGDWEN